MKETLSNFSPPSSTIPFVSLLPSFLAYLKKRIPNSSTFNSYKNDTLSLVSFAEKNGFQYLSQELCHFVFCSELAPRKKSKYIQAITRLDAFLGTHLVHPEQKLLLNSIPFGDEADAENFFSHCPYPLSNPPVGLLILKAQSILKSFNLSEGRLEKYHHAFQVFWEYCWQSSQMTYSNETFDKFYYTQKLLNEEQQRQFRRLKTIFKSICDTGTYHWHLPSRMRDFGFEAFSQVREELKAATSQRGLSRGRQLSLDHAFRFLVEALNFSGPEQLATLTPRELAPLYPRIYQGYSPGRSVQGTSEEIRTVLKLLFELGWIKLDLYPFVRVPNRTEKKFVSGFLKKEDQEKIETYIEENGSLRNKAMILLALKLGLRGGDIRKLKFENINWEEEKVVINQSKTGEPLVLPLLTEVGNALADYILNERPVPTPASPFIFLSSRAPFRPLTHQSCVYELPCRELNIQPENNGKLGSHILRKTLVHNLIEAKVPYQAITDVLGHTNKDSDMPYLSIDEERLRECALDLQEVGLPLWMENKHEY